jgi:hypothetical protein
MNICEFKAFKKDARSLAKLSGYRIIFGKNISCVDLESNTIYLSANMQKELHEAWSHLLHELSHVYCYKKNIFDNYHNYRITTIKEAFRFNALALRAEVYVDRMAEDIYNQMGFKKKFKRKFVRSYFFNKTSLKFLKKYNAKLIRLNIDDIYVHPDIKRAKTRKRAR